jgi:hypothetical protein
LLLAGEEKGRATSSLYGLSPFVNYYHWEEKIMAQIYEGSPSANKTVRQVAVGSGILFLLLGLGGLLLGEGHLGGILNIDLTEDIVHLLSAALLLYAAFGQRDAGITRTIMGVLGVLYLGVAVLGMLDARLFGLVPNGLTMWDHVVHFIFGILFVVMGFVMGRRS